MAPKAKTTATKKPAKPKAAKAVPRIPGLNAPDKKPRKAAAAKPAKPAAKKAPVIAGLTSRAPKRQLKGQKITVAWSEVKPKLKEGSISYMTAAAFQGSGRQYETGIESVEAHFKAAKKSVPRNIIQIALARLVSMGLAKVG